MVVCVVGGSGGVRFLLGGGFLSVGLFIVRPLRQFFRFFAREGTKKDIEEVLCPL